MDRQRKCMWMRDLLDHLAGCYDQWRDLDGTSAHYLADSMRRDVDEFKRLMDSLSAGEARPERVLV